MSSSSDPESGESPGSELDALVAQAEALNIVEVIQEEGPYEQGSIQIVGGQIVEDGRKKRRRKRRTVHHDQYLKYLIVMDFEATCWSGPSRSTNPNEIIEFPAVLYNLRTHRVEEEFHEYVKPSERPKLSPFCTELTGITQEQVDEGKSIRHVLNLFEVWLIQTLKQRNLVMPKFSEDDINGTVAFATWGDWDLGQCLKREMTRKGIKKPVYYNHWIDVRNLYLKHYKYRPQNFTDSLNHLNMEFEGRAHSGIDDARNLARLCGRMVSDGHLITITTDLYRHRLFYKPFYY